MLRRLDELAAAGADFAFETTLASRSFAPWIARLRAERGYRFHLAFLWLPSAEMAAMRVAGRVRHGGHSVPAPDVRRRYERGLRNFFAFYRPIADTWVLYDNSDPPPVAIASREEGRSEVVSDAARWAVIKGRFGTMEPQASYLEDREPRLMGVPPSEVTEILARAGREAIARHRALGIPVVIWRDGKPVEVPADELLR